MATDTRPELSDKNKWWISKHRYYELRHFCLQFPEWQKKFNEIDSLPSKSAYATDRVNTGWISDPVELKAEIGEYYVSRMSLVQTVAYEACDHQFWYPLLVDAVTHQKSYDILEAQVGIMPVSRNEWYVLYRKFFWCLDKLRN